MDPRTPPRLGASTPSRVIGRFVLLGDPDLLVLVDQADLGPGFPPTAFHRNDDGQWTDDAPELSADLRMAAMGVDSADLDGDGLPDYCITDIGPLRCLLSAGGSAYVESGVALGLSPSAPEDLRVWAAWSVDLLDLDDDGRLDVATAAGEFDAPPEDREHPDALWRGVDGGFEEVLDLGYGSVEDHYGLASADLDGDGGLEIVLVAPDAPAHFPESTQ
jgi:hypothetical protein